MKKLSYLIVLALILGLVLTGCLLSNVGQVPTTEQSGITYLTKHTEGGPFFTDLIADGRDLAIDVGDVLVWNDGVYLYVKYLITNLDWCLTETHVHVFLDNDGYTDVPQKNGNPPPGQFDYKEEHECVPDYTYEIPLIWDPETPLYIAAHAVVQKLSEEIVTLASGTQTLSAGYTETEPADPLDPAYYSGLGTWSAAVPVSSPPIPPWVDPSVVLPGAVWVSSAATTEGGFGDQWRLFKEASEIPPGAVITSASLTMTADNAVEAYFNGTSVGTTGDVYGTAPSSQHYNFNKLWGPYTLTPLVGPNILMFVVRNWVHTAYNPTGLTYKLDYEYQLLEEETAWGAGFDFPGKNWATYFNYLVQPVLIEEISIDPKNPAGATSTAILENEVEYEFVVSGTWENRTWERVDAKYCSADSWATPGTEAPSGGYPDELLELYVDGGSVDWGAYSDTHIYTLDFTGSGFAVNFAVHDTYYGDNVNSTMQVEIWTK